MKRDMELVRLLLLEMEKVPIGEDLDLTKIEGYESDDIHYHIMLLHQAGLIQALDGSGGGGHFDWIPEYITWEGHEFLETIRDDKKWERLMTTVGKETGGVAFELIKSTAIAWAKQKLGQIGLPTDFS